MHVTRLTDDTNIAATGVSHGAAATLAWPAAAAVIGILSVGAWIVVGRVVRLLLLHL